MPKLRFNGFTDDWEQRKLGEITGRTYGGGTPKTDVDEYWEGNIPWIQSSNLTEHQLFDVDIQKHVTEKGLQKSATQLVPANSIAVVSHVGVGKLVYMPFQYTTSQDFISLAELKTEPKFTIYAIYKRLQKDMHIVQGSAIKGITKDDLLNKEISVPVYEEQEAIGKYFSNLDNLIALHQRKCDELKKVKKYMLQKMFPKKGEKVPEIRLAGFTGDWEQRKFDEGVTEIGDGLHGTPIYSDEGDTYFVNGNNLVNGQIVIDDDTKTVDACQRSVADKELDDTTILMSINGTIGNLAYYSGEKLMLGKSAAYIKVSDYDKKFIYAYLQAPLVQRYFKDNLTGTTIKNLGLKAIREMNLSVPQDGEEQEKIGRCFYTLDNLIALHQRKHETLKEIKKYMLQNMFPEK